jgi:hypothetical protein
VPQPGSKSIAADGPGLSVTADGDVGKCGAGGGVKQVLRSDDVDEHVARPVNSAFPSVGDLDRNDRESAGASSPMLLVVKQLLD